MKLSERVRQIGTLHDTNAAAHQRLEDDLKKIQAMLQAKPCTSADIKADLNLTEKQWRRRKDELHKRGLIEQEMRTVTAPTGRYRAKVQ